MRGVETDGRKIAGLRAALQLTQEQLADKAACDVKSVRSAEKGRRLDLATIRRLSAALDVPADAILRLPSGSPGPEAERRFAVVREWARAFFAHDIEALLAVYHDDAVLAYPEMEGVPGAGTFRGKDELRRQFTTSWEFFEMQPVTPGVYRLHAVDDQVFLRCTASAIVRHTGARFTSAVLHEFEFQGDRIARHNGLWDTLAIQKAASGDQEQPVGG